MANEYYVSRYEKDRDALLKRRRPIAIRIDSAEKSLSLVGDEQLRRDYESFGREIKTYRNAVIHNPQMGTFYLSGVALMPKSAEKVEKYILWGDLIYHRNDDDFEKAQDVIVRHFEAMQMILNHVWDKLIPLFAELAAKPDYQSFLGGVPPSKPVFASSLPNPRVIITDSGTSHASGDCYR
jgi:hypothetical protein